jgi:regulatory protein
LSRERSGARSLGVTVSREQLERAALAYLDRFDSSASNLRRVLLGVVQRAERQGEVDVEAARAAIDELIARYRASGLIDDRRYAENIADGLRRRGTSARAIRHKLAARGLPAEIVEDALGAADRDDRDAELCAARALVRRRRLGPHRPDDERAARHARDLGALARAGFSFEVARRALETEPDEE